MMPPILLLNARLARNLLNTRARTMKYAEGLAKYNKRPGLQYPWESAFTGSPHSSDV